MANDNVACIFCGGETRVLAKSQGRYLTEKRRCLICGHTFEYSTMKNGARCTVNGCPEREKCLQKFNAETCAVYRMIVVQGKKVIE